MAKEARQRRDILTSRHSPQACVSSPTLPPLIVRTIKVKRSLAAIWAHHSTLQRATTTLQRNLINLTFHSPLTLLPVSHKPRTILRKSYQAIVPLLKRDSPSSSHRQSAIHRPLSTLYFLVFDISFRPQTLRPSHTVTMSADNSSPTSNSNSNSNNKPPSPPPADMHRNRRGSVTSAAFANLFQRSNSTATGTAVFPSAITSAALNEQRRRQSLTTTSLGLSGTSPTGNPSFARRASLSTNNSDSVDENAIEEEDYPFTSRAVPANSFNRRMSLGASTAMRRSGGNSPGSGNGKLTVQSPVDTVSPFTQRRGTDAVPPNPSSSIAAAASTTSWKAQPPSMTQTDPPNNSNTTRPRATSDLLSATQTDQGFNWSEQLRSRAESTVAFGQRPSFSLASGLNGSPPRAGAVQPGTHDRARSVSDMPAPPAQTPKPRSPPRDTRPKPDHFQERILKGDFYMD